MHILCRLMGHKRNKRRVTQWRESWQTECMICSTRLIRVRRRHWVPAGLIRHNRPPSGAAQMGTGD